MFNFGTFYRVDLMLPVSSSHLRRAGLVGKRENHDCLQHLKVEDRKNVETEDQDKTDAD